MANNQAPCKDCPERFIACSDHCPKDARGEYGYKAYKADLNKSKQAQKEYKRQRYESYMNSELRDHYRQLYIASRRGFNIYKDRENI